VNGSASLPKTGGNFSTFLCVPIARSQPGGYTLGAQAGEAAIRRVAETPFNAVYEARP